MPLSAEQVFDRNFDIKPFPEPARGVAITDRVHESAIALASKIGLTPIDLRNFEAPQALAALEQYRVSAVLGRGDMDNALRDHPDGRETFWNLRKREMEMIVRLGNGVGMDVQRAFDDGVMVLRTPRGNAQSVRIWQDLLLLAMYFGESDREFASRGNPAFEDNKQVKENGRVKPLHWDRQEVTDAVNPTHGRRDLSRPATVRCIDILRNKRITIVGGGGIIGREFIKQSPFLENANIIVYDPALNGESGEGFQVASTLEDALADADLVLLSLADNKEILGAKELARVKRGAKICSVAARGHCINPRALYEALESGHISGAGLDVHAAEKGEVAKFLDVPADLEARQPGHWAVLLRQHPRVFATNHSAASEAQAEQINAEDGVMAVHRYNTRGEVSNALAVYRVGFPYEGFVHERDDGGFSPDQYRGPRLAVEIFHAGEIPGLIAKMRGGLSQVVGGDLQVVDGTLRNKPFGKRLNGVEMSVIDLPEAVWPNVDERLLAELARQAEAVRGVHRVRFFRVERKAA